MGSKNAPSITVPTDPGVLGYLAGLLDGEGTVIASRTRGTGSKNDSISMRVVITNTSLPLIEWLLEEVGGTFNLKPSQKAHHRQAYSWLLGGKNAADFLTVLLPYLVVKKAQAEAGLRIASTVGKRNAPLTEEVKEIRERALAEIRYLNSGRTA